MTTLQQSQLRRAFRSPAVIIVAALAIRFLLLWLSHVYEDRTHQKFMSWGLEALLIGKSLASGHGFAEPFLHYPFVTAWLAPVYPWLISFAHLIFRLQGHSVVIYGQILNILFSAATCYLIFCLGKKVFGEQIGVASAWLWAFLPVAILMPIEWCWDQDVSAFLLVLLILFSYFLLDSSAPHYWMVYGMLWAAAALTNPTLCVTLPFIAVWLFLQRRMRAKPDNVALFARFALLFILALTPWTIRNYYEVGGLMFVKSNFGLELWLGNNEKVTGVYEHRLHPMENYAEYTLLALNNEKTYNRIKQQEAMAFIKAHPGTFARLTWNRFLDTWAAVYDVAVDTYIQPLHIPRLWVCLTGLFSIVAVAGMVIAFWTRGFETFPLTICLIVFPIPYYLTHSSLRYRHPIDPLMCILAVVALAQWSRLFRRVESQPAASTGAISRVASAEREAAEARV
jgi:4-amino-4-deoxy-L-arabinose transferase-like glycosyltransferase